MEIGTAYTMFPLRGTTTKYWSQTEMSWICCRCEMAISWSGDEYENGSCYCSTWEGDERITRPDWTDED